MSNKGIPARRTLSLMVISYFTVAVPVLLLLVNVRLVMTPAFLNFEYNRAGFPEDRYGFTQDERKEHGVATLEYLLKDLDIEYLANLTFAGGFPLYIERELRHMEDVKVVTRVAFQILYVAMLLTGLVGVFVWRQDKFRIACRRGLLSGSLLILAGIGAILFLSLVAWDTFFTGFHQLFFESGTWQFAYSDTLIRLFPEQFWFDAALVIGVLTIIETVAILGLAWMWKPSYTAVRNSEKPTQEIMD